MRIGDLSKYVYAQVIS